MKRIRFIVIVVAVIVIGGVAIATFRAREPRYQGRTLTEWIEMVMGPDCTQIKYNSAKYAVKQMAPGDIPLLLEWAHAKDPSFKNRIGSWLALHTSIHFKIHTVEDYNMMALFGFELLESEAKPA
ncbi:MAG TPA: hypothetical protein VFC07_11570 [Verrucomicrobiae bacterium]|nr:hypothetical protein [Verrucomicrobiae bacterium]